VKNTLYSLLLISLIGIQTACTNGIKQRIPPGKIHETCILLTPAELLDYEFSANAGLRFNIHYHVGDKIIYPLPEQLIAQKKGLFRPAVRQEYCLMWTNTSAAPVELVLAYTKKPLTK